LGHNCCEKVAWGLPGIQTRILKNIAAADHNNHRILVR
jgi:hypothetical protein